ncbi:PREDICTED: 2-aminoethanethiol dioxygenase [Cyprinodon variegatus]|uniref:2-aminoethanethiol (cysteamine) dioxygenase a n=1 Tax=Cyprinodon variegatus TaxID=28743 RepID=A0A3Q2CMU9_CYPVA|nr:PREDICTED: 2-aminoethanethiol dioxygenase [Cyprinodon variegatus]
MPRDNKCALIQNIAKQASLAFTDCRAAGGGVAADRLHELISLVTSVRAKDLKIIPPKSKPSSGAAASLGPPVTYMHICETEVFSMGVFLLKAGTSIPLHDHPGMNGMIKVLYGKIKVRCFDKMENSLTAVPQFDPPPAPLQAAALWRSVLRSVAQYAEDSGPCLLTPVRDNLHQIDAVDGPAAFLDILAPPYSPDDGRDCHYYKVLQSVAEPGTGAKVDQEQLGETEENEGWLLEIPQPEDFWCGGEAYPGPVVSL